MGIGLGVLLALAIGLIMLVLFAMHWVKGARRPIATIAASMVSGALTLSVLAVGLIELGPMLAGSVSSGHSSSEESPTSSSSDGSSTITLPGKGPESPPHQSPPSGSYPDPEVWRTRHLHPFIVQIYNLERVDSVVDIFGGFGIILLADRGEKSVAICNAMFRYFRVGEFSPTTRIDGQMFDTKPVFWPSLRDDEFVRDSECTDIVRAYDFTRARAFSQRLKLDLNRPYFVIAHFIGKSGVQPASIYTYDLSDVPSDEVSRALRLYIQAYNDGNFINAPKQASRRQNFKSFVLNVSGPISTLFGIAPAKGAE